VRILETMLSRFPKRDRESLIRGESGVFFLNLGQSWHSFVGKAID